MKNTILRKEVISILESIRPRLALHKGDIRFISLEEKTGVVTVRFQGTCESCPLAALTLKQGVEAVLKRKVEGISEVRAL